MKRFLSNKKGVTILEGLIALTLLALVATGTFAVLLSTSRKSSQPDLREEMALAVERAAQKLQVYVFSSIDTVDADMAQQVYYGLCGNDSQPTSTGVQHSINCLLPPVCDSRTSSFYYSISTRDTDQPLPREADQIKTKDADGDDTAEEDVSGKDLYDVVFEITCNGFTL